MTSPTLRAHSSPPRHPGTVTSPSTCPAPPRPPRAAIKRDPPTRFLHTTSLHSLFSLASLTPLAQLAADAVQLQPRSRGGAERLAVDCVLLKPSLDHRSTRRPRQRRTPPTPSLSGAQVSRPPPISAASNPAPRRSSSTMRTNLSRPISFNPTASIRVPLRRF